MGWDRDGEGFVGFEGEFVVGTVEGAGIAEGGGGGGFVMSGDIEVVIDACVAPIDMNERVSYAILYIPNFRYLYSSNSLPLPLNLPHPHLPPILLIIIIPPPLLIQRKLKLLLLHPRPTIILHLGIRLGGP